jgi:heme oxygenase
VNVIDHIRQSLGPIHSAIEQTNFAKGMISGTISRTDYTFGLSQLLHMHTALETALEETGNPGPYRPEDMARRRIVEQDLMALGVDTPEPAVDCVAELCETFARWAVDCPEALLGAVYVFEGSRMGSMALARPVSRALGVDLKPGHGVDYHIDGMASRPQAWARFKAELAGLNLPPEKAQMVSDAAVATMTGLYQLYAHAGVEAALNA